MNRDFGTDLAFAGQSADGIPLPAVDGPLLVVSSGTVLPPICVKTGDPVADEDMLRKTYYWCPPLVLLLALVNLVLLAIVYFIVRKKCELSFGLDPHLRAKYRNRVVMKTLALVGLLVALPFAIATDRDILWMGVLFLLIVVVVWCCFGNAPLRIVKSKNARFWVKGVSPECLERIEREMSANAVCPACGEALRGSVAFCPMCGERRAPAPA